MRTLFNSRKCVKEYAKDAGTSKRKRKKIAISAPSLQVGKKFCYTHPNARPLSSLVHIDRSAVRGLFTRPRSVRAADCSSRALQLESNLKTDMRLLNLLLKVGQTAESA